MWVKTSRNELVQIEEFVHLGKWRDADGDLFLRGLLPSGHIVELECARRIDGKEDVTSEKRLEIIFEDLRKCLKAVPLEQLSESQKKKDTKLKELVSELINEIDGCSPSSYRLLQNEKIADTLSKLRFICFGEK
jgi:hypothetical protein